MSLSSRKPHGKRVCDGLGELLVSAETIRRRVIDDGEPCRRVTDDLNVEESPAKALVRCMRRWGCCPPPARLALLATNDPGLEPEDICLWFGRGPEWWGEVMAERAALLALFPDQGEDEAQAAGVLPADPSPEQIRQMTDGIREGWDNPGLRIRSARWIGEQFARAVSYVAY